METYKSRMVEVRISQAISLHEIFSEVNFVSVTPNLMIHPCRKNSRVP